MGITLECEQDKRGFVGMDSFKRKMFQYVSAHKMLFCGSRSWKKLSAWCGQNGDVSFQNEEFSISWDAHL